MAGDVSCNRGPINISTAKSNFSAGTENYLDIPMPMTRHLIEVPIVNEQRQRQSVEDLWMATFIIFNSSLNILQTNSQKLEAGNSPTKMDHTLSLKAHMD